MSGSSDSDDDDSQLIAINNKETPKVTPSQGKTDQGKKKIITVRKKTVESVVKDTTKSLDVISAFNSKSNSKQTKDEAISPPETVAPSGPQDRKDNTAFFRAGSKIQNQVAPAPSLSTTSAVSKASDADEEYEKLMASYAKAKTDKVAEKDVNVAKNDDVIKPSYLNNDNNMDIETETDSVNEIEPRSPFVTALGAKRFERPSVIRQRIKDKLARSGLAKFFDDDPDKIKHDDFDSGVNALALLCALVLAIPYQVLSDTNPDHLSWVKTKLDACPVEEGSWGYQDMYNNFRASVLVTIYMSISGMILATFYFLFKRNNAEDYKVWRNKARILVIILFLCTAFAFMGLILLTNLHFSYHLLSDYENICDNDTGNYTIPGLAFTFFMFLLGFYLIY